MIRLTLKFYRHFQSFQSSKLGSSYILALLSTLLRNCYANKNVDLSMKVVLIRERNLQSSEDLWCYIFSRSSSFWSILSPWTFFGEKQWNFESRNLPLFMTSKNRKFGCLELGSNKVRFRKNFIGVVNRHKRCNFEAKDVEKIVRTWKTTTTVFSCNTFQK